jgi:c-di-GMP-related signal transduction protein
MGKEYKKDSDFSIPEHLLPYIDLPDFVKIDFKQTLIDQQMKNFGKEEEL